MRGPLFAALILLGCGRPRAAAPDASRPAALEAPDVAAAVEEEAPVVAPPMSPSSEAESRAFAGGVDGFAWRVFRELSDRPGNRVFSPSATAVSLSMAAALDRGPAGAQALHAIAETLDADAVHRASGTALRAWQSELGDGSGLLAVQRVFVDRAVRLEDPVSERLRGVYGAPVGVVDTGGPEGARRRIDGFLHARMRGAAPEAIPEHAIVADGPAVVASAALARFVCGGEVTSMSFRVGGVSPVETRAARCARDLRSGRGEAFTLWRVPSADGAYALDVLVPDESERLRAFEARLDAASVRVAVEALRPAREAVTIPTVQVSNESPDGLRNTLMKLGFGDLFDPERSSLARVGPGGRWVSELYHRARFDLDVTDAPAAPGSVARIIDRPFVFVLRDRRLGTALAMGHVVDPGR